MKTKEQKKKEADVRQLERAMRTDKEQLDRLDSLGHAAKKERERLSQ